MEKLLFKLDQFEGPLDLLLHLIAKHKLDIHDIEIAQLVDQYITYIEAVQQTDMEVASEFLEMAARLVYLKSLALLPKHEDVDGLKQELEGQLLEYQTIKEIAVTLFQLYVGEDIFVRESEPVQIDYLYSSVHPSDDVYNAMMAAIGKSMRRLPPPETAFSGIVKRRVVSVASRIVFVLRRLYNDSQVGFDELFAESGDRSERVATFLAVLELVKANRVAVSDDARTLWFRQRKETH